MSKFVIDYNWQIPNKNGLHVRETRGENYTAKTFDVDKLL